MSIIPRKPPDDHARYRLIEKILRLSVATTWPDAVSEWFLQDLYTDKESPGTCLCGHSPIVEHCVIGNAKNGKTAIVGNVCVSKFMGLPSEKLFAALKRIARDKSASPGEPLIQHAISKGWLSEFERGFSLNTVKKIRPHLTKKQLDIRIKINGSILAHCREGVSVA